MVRWLKCWQSKLYAGVEEATFHRMLWLWRHNVKQRLSLCKYSTAGPDFAERPYFDSAPLWGGVCAVRGELTGFTCDRPSTGNKKEKERYQCCKYGHPAREEKVVGCGGRTRSHWTHIWAGCVPEVSSHSLYKPVIIICHWVKSQTGNLSNCA